MEKTSPIKLEFKKEPLEKAIYLTLKKAIQSGYLMPGERLVETSLAEDLCVSRTPLRDAIRKLAFEKLVNIAPNKGATVAKLSSVDIEEIYFLASVLEGAAAKKAVDNMTNKDIKKLKEYHYQMKEAISENAYERWIALNNKFHGVFVHKSKVPGLVELIREKVGRISHFWYLYMMRPDPLHVYTDAHEKIIEAFEKKDKELVRTLVENHITTNRDILKEYLNTLF